jgi:hypothetical protein
MLNAPLPTMEDAVILNLLMYFQDFNYFFLQNDINRRLDSPRHTCHPEI